MFQAWVAAVLYSQVPLACSIVFCVSYLPPEMEHKWALIKK